MTEAPLKERVASRKFLLMVSIFIFSTFALVAPALLALSGVKIATILAGGEYVSLVIGCFAIYSGANVAQKKLVDVNVNGGGSNA